MHGDLVHDLLVARPRTVLLLLRRERRGRVDSDPGPLRQVGEVSWVDADGGRPHVDVTGGDEGRPGHELTRPDMPVEGGVPRKLPTGEKVRLRSVTELDLDPDEVVLAHGVTRCHVCPGGPGTDPVVGCADGQGAKDDGREDEQHPDDEPAVLPGRHGQTAGGGSRQVGRHGSPLGVSIGVVRAGGHHHPGAASAPVDCPQGDPGHPVHWQTGLDAPSPSGAGDDA